MTQPTNSFVFPSFLALENDSQTEATNSANKRPHSDSLGSDSMQTSVEERTSKLAKQLGGQDAVTNGFDLADKPQRSSSRPLVPASISLSAITNAGSRSGPLNHILNCLDLSDMISLRETARQFRRAIQTADIPFTYKQQLEYKKSVDQTELNQYQKISGENLYSEKIESLYLQPDDDYGMDLEEDMFGLKREDFLSIPQRFPNLKHICLQRSYIADIDDFNLVQWIRPYENLQTLEFISLDITDEILIALSENCPHLKSFTVCDCERVTNQGLIAVVRKCRDLQNLSISESNEITDTALAEIAQNCSQLKRFAVRNCAGVTDRGLIAVIQRCYGLQELNIAESSEITNNAFIEIAQNCSKLENLDFSKVEKLTDEALVNLSKGCPNLATITIEGIEGDEFNRFASQYCLNVTRFSQFTDRGIIALAENCPRLKCIDITDCPAINSETIQKIREAYPKLQIHSKT